VAAVVGAAIAVAVVATDLAGAALTVAGVAARAGIALAASVGRPLLPAIAPGIAVARLGEAHSRGGR
jgi:hypothetical protein